MTIDEIALILADKIGIVAEDCEIVEFANALLAELAKQETPALKRYNDVMHDEPGNDPVENLQVFLSFALSGQDWIDVEPFIEAVRRAGSAGMATD